MTRGARSCPQDDGDIPIDTEAKILDVLLRIRKQDPSIYQSEVHFFAQPEGSEGSSGPSQEAGTKQQKPLLLKDVIAKQVSPPTCCYCCCCCCCCY
jgi:hypothetical protein